MNQLVLLFHHQLPKRRWQNAPQMTFLCHQKRSCLSWNRFMLAIVVPIFCSFYQAQYRYPRLNVSLLCLLTTGSIRSQMPYVLRWFCILLEAQYLCRYYLVYPTNPILLAELQEIAKLSTLHLLFVILLKTYIHPKAGDVCSALLVCPTICKLSV